MHLAKRMEAKVFYPMLLPGEKMPETRRGAKAPLEKKQSTRNAS